MLPLIVNYDGSELLFITFLYVEYLHLMNVRIAESPLYYAFVEY